METKKNYLILKETYLDGRLDKKDIIAICDNRLDAYVNLLSCFVSLSGSYIVDYKYELKGGICFEKKKSVQGEPKELIEFTIHCGEPNIHFCLYNLCDLSDVLNAMMNLELFNA